MTPQVVTPKGLGPGFWTTTAVMTVINIALAVWIVTAHFDFLLPAESNAASDTALMVDGLFKFMTVFGVAITVYVNGYALYFAIAFRRRRDEAINTVGPPIHDAPKLEFWWTAIPTLLLVVLMGLTYVVWRQEQFPQVAAGLTMEVVAHQFNFEFRYPGVKAGLFSPAAEMHVPAGKPLRILVSSGDVIHQFWVPEFRTKVSAVPGMVTDINVTPTHPGTYWISCSEYCGINHSKMQAKLVVEEPAAFQKWLANEQATVTAGGAAAPLASGDAKAGQALFAQKCAACHEVAPFEDKRVGPGLAKITDDPNHPTLVTGKPPTAENIAAILANGYTGPIGVMPNQAANGLSGQDIANLVAYLISLK